MSNYKNVQVTDLETLGSDVRFIDVREPAEFNGELGHLPRAELVPMGSFPAAAEDWDKGVSYLVICRSGNRSGQIASLLSSLGFSKIMNLAGGMNQVRANS